MMDYDALLTGSGFAPSVEIIQQEPVGKEQATPGGGSAAATAAKSGAAPQTIVLVWFILLALLVMAHLVTLSLQK